MSNQANQGRYRFARGLEQMLAYADRELPIIEVDSQTGVYTAEFIKAGFNPIVIEPFGENPAVQGRAQEIVTKALEDVIIPFRSVSAVWIAQALSFIPRSRVQRWLELCFDWLAKDGCLFCTLLEGEGHRVVTNQGAAKIEQKTEYYYQPEELNAMLLFAGFEIMDAWRQGGPERPWMHIFARKSNQQ